MNNIYAHKPRTTAYGLDNVSFLAQNLWRDLQLHVKESLTVKHFKKGIKFWNFTCNCRLCKSHIVNLGYIWFVNMLIHFRYGNVLNNNYVWH